jgi:23S rRNA (uracil1939-C5)-methyltransferase
MGVTGKDFLRPDLLTVRLDKLVYGGDALGRLPDGRAAFVPFGLPGETVNAKLVDEKSSRVRLELVEVLEPSSERIAPRCRHFGMCGGCQYQHLSYQSQLQWKRDILCDQLRRIGKIQAPPVEAVVASSSEWNYRNHIQFHLTQAGKLGYVGTNDQDVIPISECHLPEERLNTLWPGLEFDTGLHLERVSLRAGLEGESMLVLESSHPEPPELELEASLSVVHLTGGDLVVMAGDDHIRISLKERIFRVSAASFFQVNTGMTGRMVEHLLDCLPVTSGTTLLDVYCGVGLFSAFFAGRVGRLVGIEVSPSACEDYAANLDEFENVELYEAPAEMVLPGLELRPEIVILDPPRAGLEKHVLEALLVSQPERIAYVSCDPATLGRDLARFIAGGYRLVQVTPFDLFPQTYSIESISILEKESFTTNNRK